MILSSLMGTPTPPPCMHLRVPCGESESAIFTGRWAHAAAGCDGPCSGARKEIDPPGRPAGAPAAAPVVDANWLSTRQGYGHFSQGIDGRRFRAGIVMGDERAESNVAEEKTKRATRPLRPAKAICGCCDWLDSKRKSGTRHHYRQQLARSRRVY